jgi:hypothetical protein
MIWQVKQSQKISILEGDKEGKKEFTWEGYHLGVTIELPLHHYVVLAFTMKSDKS